MRHHLLLLRHAKSSWADPAVPDHDRPLAPRGEKAVWKIRKRIPQLEPRTELVFCSPARRTVQTLEGVRSALPDDATVSIEHDLYLADANELLLRLQQVDDGVRSVLVVGHNPGLHDLATMLAGSGDTDLRARMAAKYPTGALAHLSFTTPWAELGPGVARLDDLFVPRAPRTAP